MRLPDDFSPFRLSFATRVWLAIGCVLHGVVGGSVGLSVDEAHYALYAVHLEWSYFDHPPLVGWVQWPLVAAGAPEWFMRLVPQMLWLLTALLVHALALRLQPHAESGAYAAARLHAGDWAVAVFALTPVFHVLGIGLLPDTLLMALGCAVMWVVLDLREPSALSRWGVWAALGMLLGLAGLSKYTAILWAVAAAFCLLGWHGVRVLMRPGLWLAVLLAAACIAPVLVWNAQNQWMSFAYQLQHGKGGAWQAESVLRFAMLQLVVYGPLMLWAAAGARPSGSSKSMLLVFFAMPFAVLALTSAGGTSLPHWTAPAWACLVPFVGVGLVEASRPSARKSRLQSSLMVLQALACVVLLGAMVTAGQPFLRQDSGQGNRAQPPNPFADLHGWETAGVRARELAAQWGLSSVSVQNWTLASRIGWYARPLPVHVLEDRFDQFALWAGPLAVGESTLLLDWSQMGYAVPLGSHGFAECKLLDTVQVSRMGATIATFRFYACSGWSGDPQPRLLANS